MRRNLCADYRAAPATPKTAAATSAATISTLEKNVPTWNISNLSYLEIKDTIFYQDTLFQMANRNGIL